MRKVILLISLVASIASAEKSNTLSIVGGEGPNGAIHMYHNNLIPNNLGAVAGLSYQHRIDALSIGAEALNNKTYLLSLGLNF